MKAHKATQTELTHLVTVEALALRWGLKETTVRRWLREHKLPGVRLGRKWFLPVDQLNKLVGR
jgi:excisionase family DNA binding protein